MSGLWTITVPEAGTNVAINPSFETDLTGWAAYGATATVSRSMEYARWGVYSLKCVTNNAASGEGAQHSYTSVSPSTAYTLTIYGRGTGTFGITIEWYTGAGAFISTSASGTFTLSSTTWQRFTLSATSPGTTGRLVADFTTPTQQAATFYFDGFQIEASAYATTYIDGDQPGCKWTGLVHASTSTRDAQHRLGGREVDIETTYGVKVLSGTGIGMPTIANNLQPMSLQPGAIFQSYKIMPRTIDLLVSTQVSIGTAYTTLHTRRDSLISLFAPDQYGGDGAIRIGYTGASSTRTVYGEYRYDGGLEFQSQQGRNEKIPLRLIAVDPLLYEDTQEVASLGFTSTISNTNKLAARVNGAWQTLGTGITGTQVYKIAVDKQHGRIYYAGDFTAANGVTVNRITYWNGTTFVAMDAGVNGTVYALSIAPNGDVWIGGSFTTVGSGATACKGLARWNYAAGNWTAFNNATTTFTGITAISITPDTGDVYIGGDFTNWDGGASEDYISKYTPSAGTWAALGSGTNGAVWDIAAMSNSKVYVAGDFTTANGVTVNRITYWNGTTFVALGGGASHVVYSIAVDVDGNVYIAGNFSTTPTTSYIARWNGSAWSALGTGLNATGYSLAISDLGSLLVGGSFTSAGGLSIADRIALWNGSSWTPLDIDLPSTPIVTGMAWYGDDIYLGFDTGVNSTAAAITTVTPSSSSQTYPVIVITGPTTANTSCTLQWIENQSTGHLLYFNLTILAGVTVVIDLRTGVKTVTSTFTGINNTVDKVVRSPVSGVTGRIYGQPLRGSDLDNFHLLPRANTIACFIGGTTTGVTATMIWRPTHWSVDGVA